MRKAFIGVLIIISTNLFAQTTTQYLGGPNTRLVQRGVMVNDSGFSVPKDTLWRSNWLDVNPFLSEKNGSLFMRRYGGWLGAQKWFRVGPYENGYGIGLNAAGVFSVDSTVITNKSFITGAVEGEKTDFILSIDSNGNVHKLPPPVYDKHNYSEQSSGIRSYDWTLLNSNVAPPHWRDGVNVANIKDSVLYVFGGWFTTPLEITDSIYKSLDGGVTWVAHNVKIPYAVHTSGYFVAPDGWHYIIGGDYTSSVLHKHTVSRTKDFLTFQTMTSTAPWSNRILGEGFAANGKIYFGGGQDSLTGHELYHDLWESSDGGANWSLFTDSINVAGDYFFGSNLVGTLKEFNGYIYKVSGGVYKTTLQMSRKVYKTRVTDLKNWTRIDDIPVTGKQYPRLEVWDGKLWMFFGTDSSGNSSDVCFLDKNDKWTIARNKLESGTLVAATHATAVTVYQDRVIRVLGNNTNSAYALGRGSTFSAFAVRDSLRVLNSILSQTVTDSATIIGNRVRAGTAAGTIIHTKPSDGSFVRIHPTEGLSYHAAVTSTINTEVSDQLYSIVRFFPDGRVIVNGGTWAYSKGSTYKFQVNGPTYLYAATAQALMLENGNTITSTKWKNSSADNGFIEYNANGDFDIYSLGSFAATFSAGKSRIRGTSISMEGAQYIKTNVAATGLVNVTIATNDYYVELPNITATNHLTVTMPTGAGASGRKLEIKNNSTNGTYSYQFSATVLDKTGATVTNLANQTVYTLVNNGTNWVITMVY
jgi:hypothetical protein